MRPFGYPVTILNTLDHLSKFYRKADEGFFVGYSVNSKAFRVFNSRTRIVEETLHITFLENKPNVAGSGPEWLFDIDTLTKSMNYKPVVLGNQTNEDEININSTNIVFTISSPINTAGTKDDDVNSTNSIYTASPLVNFDGLSYFNTNPPDDPKMPNLEDTGIFGGVYDDEDIVVGGDMNNLESSLLDELLQFKLKKVWTLVDLPYGKRAIGTKWVYMNKKDERGIVVRNKARLVAQGYTKEEGIDYDEVFALVVRIEVIRLFLAYASFMNFVVYQMDVKSAFLYGKIEEEVYVYQPLGFEDLEFPNRVYKVEKAFYGLHQAPRAWPDIMFAVCACVRFQVTPKVSHLHAVKRIFRYLKGQPKLGLWYPKDLPLNLEAYSDSDYAGASLDKKSTTRGCQFLRSRLISWQCKKQTIVANSTTEAELMIGMGWTYYLDKIGVYSGNSRVSTAGMT
ncbi:retrovirus-related pol polyprotein from transposon TNT 1-94 [Tanacetum coccineum]|uniref:Retrovirus-related pol polyprotein from transposon TNT 1-94 n=1 Tax=Tanacetum coccineum TaxID=301880 RepID=A0ABQ5B7U3_9ASTR